MKSTFKLSTLVASIIPVNRRDAVIQACEASLNRRVESARESSGTKNQKKTGSAVSSETVDYTMQSDVVTAFIEYAENTVGAVDKAIAKAAKLGIAGGTVETLPATFKGQDIAAWLAKMNKAESKPAKPAKGAESKPALAPLVPSIA